MTVIVPREELWRSRQKWVNPVRETDSKEKRINIGDKVTP